MIPGAAPGRGTAGQRHCARRRDPHAILHADIRVSIARLASAATPDDKNCPTQNQHRQAGRLRRDHKRQVHR